MLTGHGTGTRAEIITTAQDQAARYYGLADNRCVQVTLTDETATIQDAGTYTEMGKTIVTGFTANWAAEVSHRWEQRAYGFPKCVSCQKEKHR